jgi:hypothetical protein
VIGTFGCNRGAQASKRKLQVGTFKLVWELSWKSRTPLAGEGILLVGVGLSRASRTTEPVAISDVVRIASEEFVRKLWRRVSLQSFIGLGGLPFVGAHLIKPPAHK